MALWQTYLANKFIFENHPALDDTRCLNTIQTKAPCTICATICPNQVFGKEPRWDLCDNCGLCAAACPARCIAPSSIEASKLLDTYQHIGDTISIACRNTTTSADYTVACLAALPWEVLALFAQNCTVTIYTAQCQSCEKNSCLLHFWQTLKTVQSFLGEERYQTQIQLIHDDTSPIARPYSRREAFSLFSSKSKTMVSNLLPDIEALLPTGLFWMQLLTHSVSQLNESASSQSTYHMQLPFFTDRCTACGICTKLCPGQALHRLQYEEYQNQWFMALLPWRCTNCGLCTQICPLGGIQAATTISLSNLKKPLLHQLTAHSCTRCGEPVTEQNPLGLCQKCLAEQPPKLTL